MIVVNRDRNLKPPASTVHHRAMAGLFCLGTFLLLLPAPAEESDGPPPLETTLAYHLSTNAVGYAAGCNPEYKYIIELDAPVSSRLTHYARADWSSSFWLKDVQGLSATSIGFSNVLNGQGLPTMVSPRHYLCATHMHPEGHFTAFLDTNNAIHWRRTLQRVDIGHDTSVGILDKDLPPSVGFLPVLPDNFTNFLPVTGTNVVQGIGMNQDMYLFSQPMTLYNKGDYISWNASKMAPSGLSTNWNIPLRGGDSSNPEMLLIGNQLVLVSHNFTAGSGPNYARQIPAIDRAMHLLSTNNHVQSDYQLTEFPLTNWPMVH